MQRCAKTLVPVSGSSIARARAFVQQALQEWQCDDDGAVIALLTSELVTNAIGHADGPVTLAVSVNDGLLRVEASDDDPALPVIQPSDPFRESGRGMQLIDTLARRWGAERRGNSKVVWFESAVGPPVTPT